VKLKLVVFLLLANAAIQALPAKDAGAFPEDAGNKYWIRPDVVYGVENGHENKLDVIYPHNATAAVPAVIYIHGGGWVFGDKAGSVLETLPYLKMGWAAVNVEIRERTSSIPRLRSTAKTRSRRSRRSSSWTRFVQRASTRSRAAITWVSSRATTSQHAIGKNSLWRRACPGACTATRGSRQCSQSIPHLA
jgi:hypothetical protein